MSVFKEYIKDFDSDFLDEKGRYWAFEMYPDSVDPQWPVILNSFGVRAAVSPLHDQDKWTDEEVFKSDGHLNKSIYKKPHYHVLLAFEGPTTCRKVLRILFRLNCPKYIVAVHSPRGYYAYLTHSNNPDKFQYSELGIQLFNGFRISDIVEFTMTETQLILAYIFDLIETRCFVSYRDLIVFLRKNKLNDEFIVANNHLSVIKEYIYGFRNSAAVKEFSHN